MVIDQERRSEVFGDSVRSEQGVAGVLFDEDREFVAAEAGDGVAGAQGAGEAFCDADEQRVTGGVTEGVVDLFEVVEVQPEHGEGDMFAALPRDCMLEPVQEQARGRW